MKPVLAWVKKNLVAVICAVVAVIVLPTSIVLSSSWTGKVRDEAEKKASDELKNVESNKVTYGLPAVLPNVIPPSVSTEPNSKLTEYMKAQKDRLLSEAGAIGTRAEQINKRTPLIEGLFPKPKSLEEGESKGLEFADMLLGGPKRPGVYQKLFERMHAGMPPSPDTVGVMVRDAREREVEKIKAGRQDRQLTPEENTEITKRLVDLRQSEYRKRASELSFYASFDVLSPADDFLTKPPAQAPKPPQAFKWQWDFWVVQDVLDAIAKANGADKGRLGVDGSVIKRVEMLHIGDGQADSMRTIGQVEERPQSNFGAPPPADPNAAKALVQPNFVESVTGRRNTSTNQVYSLRYATLQMVVSSARLRIFDAFAGVNFMTIDRMTITAIDPWKDLEEGYYYGDEPVVRLRIRVETVWLRSWLAPLMPEPTRKALGVAYSEPKSDEKPGEAAQNPRQREGGERPREGGGTPREAPRKRRDD